MFKVAIKNNATSEVRVHEDEGDWVKDDPETGFGSSFYWTEGNCGCDCNRERLWLYAGNEEDPPHEIQCSEGRFSIEYVELPNGERIQLS